MTRSERRCLVRGFVVGAALAGSWWLYNQRPRARIAGPGGLEDPQVARAFGRVSAWPQMGLMRAYVVQRAIKLNPHLDGHAVDLGCGPGQLAIDLARQAPRLRVTGMDLSQDMLAQGRENASRAGLEQRITFRAGDASQIPFEEDSLDLVISSLSMHHWEDPLIVLNEIARVLRPGGAFVIFDLRRDLALPAWLLLWFVTRFIVPRALRRVNEPLRSRDAAYTPEEAAALAWASDLTGWRITRGPLWLTIEGHTGFRN